MLTTVLLSHARRREPAPSIPPAATAPAQGGDTLEALATRAPASQDAGPRHDADRLRLALARTLRADSLPAPGDPQFVRAVELRQRELVVLLGSLAPEERERVLEFHQDQRNRPRRTDPGYIPSLVIAHQLALAGERVRNG